MSTEVDGIATETTTGRGSTAPLSDAELPALDQSIPPWPGTFQQVLDTLLHVRVTPGPEGAPAAVYVHGLGGSATNWTDLAALLSGRVNGYALDMPGFGKTEPDRAWPFTPEAQADLVIAFIESLGEEPVHLFGNSLGGLTSILVAARRPDLVRTLTLISPAVPDRRPDLRRISDPRMVLAWLPVVGKRVRRQLAGMTARQRAMQVIELCFANPEALPENRLAEAEAEAGERSSMPWAGSALSRAAMGMFRTWSVLGSASVWRALASISAPSLVIWGTRDRLVTVRKAPKTAHTLRNGRLLVLRDTGHVAQLEYPVTVARAVLGLWEQA